MTVRPVPRADRDLTVAVLPVQNLSGSGAPTKLIRQLLTAELKRRGFHVLPYARLYKFMARHRMRYTGGISAKRSEAIKKETGAGAVLITSLETYSKQYPPEIALFSRLVKVGSWRPVILWMDSAAMTGDDSPGLLDTGLVYDPAVLAGKAVKKLSISLCNALEGKKTWQPDVTMAGRFKPSHPFKSSLLDPKHKYKVLVVPFYNLSNRGNAGQIMQLQFMQQLLRYPSQFQVIDPGLIRHEFLNIRIIQWDGISLDNVKLLFALLDADMLVSGKVLHYRDNTGPPLVSISAIAIERKSRRIVWSSTNYAHGDDGVYFFDTGKINTAHTVASEMARWDAKSMAGPH